MPFSDRVIGSFQIFLKNLVREKYRAWDFGTGSAQVAYSLASFMKEVSATWLAVKHYEKVTGHNPVELVNGNLKMSFGKGGTIIFPISLRIRGV